MSGSVYQRHVPDLTGRATYKGGGGGQRGDGDGEAKEVVRVHKGRETIDVNGERGKGDRNMQKYTYNTTTNDNQRRSAKRR